MPEGPQQATRESEAQASEESPEGVVRTVVNGERVSPLLSSSLHLSRENAGLVMLDLLIVPRQFEIQTFVDFSFQFLCICETPFIMKNT